MTPENKPQDYNLPDPKWRFFWRIGEPPKETKFSSLNLPPVIPEGETKRNREWDGVEERVLLIMVCEKICEVHLRHYLSLFSLRFPCLGIYHELLG